MFVRFLFLLLFAGNLGMAAWIGLGPRPQIAAPAVATPGVPVLRLLSERSSATSNVAELASAPEPINAINNDRCNAIGPFETQADLRAAMDALTPLVKRLRYRETQGIRDRGFLITLPAQDTREKALDLARQLSEKGVRDYYVVTSGQDENSISLGLFRDPDNADRRRAEIAALGFQPRMVQRREDTRAYWLDFALEPNSPFNWRDALPSVEGIGERVTGCF